MNAVFCSHLSLRIRTLFMCWLFTVAKKKQGMGSSVKLVEYTFSSSIVVEIV